VLKSEKYYVTIHADGKLYKTRGAIAITSTNPMVDVAGALLAKGAPPHSLLEGRYEGVSMSTTQLHRLARNYVPPRVRHREGDPSRNVD
jgi:hypothetical protein